MDNIHLFVWPISAKLAMQSLGSDFNLLIINQLYYLNVTLF